MWVIGAQALGHLVKLRHETVPTWDASIAGGTTMQAPDDVSFMWQAEGGTEA